MLLKQEPCSMPCGRTAQLVPDHVAVVYEEQQLTYRKLNERANQLARKLRKEGIGRESIVGILSERSVDMLVGVLAVWKAGGAYVPLDADYPSERIRFMLEDSGAMVLLTQTRCKSVPRYGWRKANGLWPRKLR
ncbi:bacitracin synthetase 1 [Paenibacillus polymyxa]|uniref:AMP-binding protein n=1 Tax=Paenibacillus polymyxa TaxID=1406 RepID=UPI000D94581A|nr:AMP-binding protein [Paenibacillus polymyxa]SPY15923.1 bacitracin synthetase 1 [Paenibacillus polymyxa]